MPEEAPRKPSNGIAALAAALPVLFVCCGCVLFGVARGGVASSAHAIEEMGFGFYLIVLATLIAVPTSCVLVFLGARGFRAPSALAVGASAFPWLAGLAGTWMGVSLAAAAVENADPSWRATMMAAGVSEASRSRFLGALLSSALLAAVAFGLAIGALNQRAKGREPIVGALIGLTALPLLALSLYGVVAAGFAPGLPLLVAGLGAALAIPLAAAGAGDDRPHGRSGALAASVPVAAGLTVLAAAVASSTAALVELFGALAHVEASSRLSVVGMAAAEVGPLRLASWLAGPLALLAAASVAGWAVSRAKPTIGHLAGGAALVGVAVILVAGDALIAGRSARLLEEMSAPPWGEVGGFEPLALSDADEIQAIDAFVVPTGLVDRHGDALAPLEPEALAEALRALRGSRGGAGARAADAWLDEPAPDPTGAGVLGVLRAQRDPSRGFPEASDVTLGLDARLDAAALRTLLAAARAAELRALSVQGADADGPSDEARAEVRARLPLLAGFLGGSAAVEVVLEAGVPAGAPERDPTLRHAVVGAQPTAELAVRAGAALDPSERALPDDRRRGRERDLGPSPVVYLGVGDAASAASVFETAARAARAGMRPVVVAGAIPGAPERAGEAEVGFGASDLGRGGGAGEGTIGLGNLGALGRGGGAEGTGYGRSVGRLGGRGPEVRAGESDVRGSLSRELIRRVVRRHLNEVRYCYERQLTQRPGLEGRVTVSFIVGPTGAVQSSTLASSTLGDPGAEQCIVTAVRRWTFPAPDGGGVVAVSYPFALSPSR